MNAGQLKVDMMIIDDSTRLPSNRFVNAVGKTVLFTGCRIRDEVIMIQCRKIIFDESCQMKCLKLKVNCEDDLLQSGSIECSDVLEIVAKKFITKVDSEIKAKKMVVDCDRFWNSGSIQVSKEVLVTSKERFESFGLLCSRDLMVITGKKVVIASGTVLGVKESRFFCSELKIRTKCFYHCKLFVSGDCRTSSSCSRIVVDKSARIKCKILRCNVCRIVNEGLIIVEKLVAIEKCEVFSNLGIISMNETGIVDEAGELMLILETSKFFNRGIILSKVLQVFGKCFRNRRGGKIISGDHFSCGRSSEILSKIQVLREFENDGKIEGGNRIDVLSKRIMNSGNITGLMMTFGSDFKDSKTKRSVRNKVHFESLRNYGKIGHKILCHNLSFFGNSFVNHGDVKSKESIQINLNKGFCSSVFQEGLIGNIRGLLCENTLSSRMISLYSPVVLCYGLKVCCNRYNEASLIRIRGLSLEVMNLRNVLCLFSIDLASFNIPNVKQLLRTFSRSFPDLLEDICVNNIGITVNLVLNFLLDILQIVVVSNPRSMMSVGMIRAGLNGLCFLPSTFSSAFDLIVHLQTLPVYRIVACLSSIGMYGKIVGFSIVEGLSAKKICDKVQNGMMSSVDARKFLTGNAFGSVRGVLSYLNSDTSMSFLTVDGLSTGFSFNNFKMSVLPVEFGNFGVGFSKRIICCSSFGVGNVLMNWNHGETSVVKVESHFHEVAQNLSLEHFAFLSLKGKEVVYGGRIHSVYYCVGKTYMSLHHVQCVGKGWKVGDGTVCIFSSCSAAIDDVANNGTILIPSGSHFQLQGNLVGSGTVGGEGVVFENGDLGCHFQGKLKLIHNGEIVDGIGGSVEEYHCVSSYSSEYVFGLLGGTGIFGNFGVVKRLCVTFQGSLVIDRELNGRFFEKVRVGENKIDEVNVVVCGTEDFFMNHEQPNVGYSISLRSSNGSVVLNKKISTRGNIVLLSENGNVIRRNDLMSECGDVYVIAPNGMDNVVLKFVEECSEYVHAHVASGFVSTREGQFENGERIFVRRGLNEKKEGCTGIFESLFSRQEATQQSERVENFPVKTSKIGFLPLSPNLDSEIKVNRRMMSQREKETSRSVVNFESDYSVLTKKESTHTNSKVVDEALHHLIASGFSGNDELGFEDLIRNIENGKDVMLGLERKEVDRSPKIISFCGGIYEEVGGVVLCNASYVCPKGDISIMSKEYVVILGDVRREVSIISDWKIDKVYFNRGKFIGNHVFLNCLNGGIFLCGNVIANDVVLSAKGNIFLGNSVSHQVEEKVRRRFFGLCRKKIRTSRELESCVIHYVNNYSIESEGDVLALGVNFFDLFGGEKDIGKDGNSSFVVKSRGSVTFEKRILTNWRKESGFAVGLQFPFMRLNKNGKLRPNVMAFLDNIKREVDKITDPVRRILKHGASVNRMLESLFSFAHRFDWKTGNLKMINQIMNAKEYLRKLKSGRFDFTVGISLNYTSVERMFESLGLGSMYLSNLVIETPEDVVFRNNYALEVDDCSIRCKRLFFDSADLRSSNYEHSSTVGVGVSFSVASGKTKQLSVGWDVSGEFSKESTLWHAATIIFVNTSFHLDVDTCSLEGVFLKCKELSGRVGRLELKTLQKTSRKVEGKVSISNVGFYADGDIELSRKNDAVTTIECEDLGNFSVGVVVQDRNSALKDVNGNVMDLGLLASEVVCKKGKEHDHHLNMEFQGKWERQEEICPPLIKYPSDNIDLVVRNGDGVDDSEGSSLKNLSFGGVSSSQGGIESLDSEVSNMIIDADLLKLGNASSHVRDEVKVPLESRTTSDGESDIVDMVSNQNGDEVLAGGGDTELLPLLGVLLNPSNLFCLLDPDTVGSVESMKEYWTENVLSLIAVGKHPYEKLFRPVGNWLRTRYLEGHTNAKNFSSFIEPLALCDVPMVSFAEGKKIAVGIRKTSWEDTRVAVKEYGKMLFTPEYGDVFLNIAPLFGFAKVSLELLTGRSSLSGEKISVVGHLALLGMHASGHLYWCKCNSQPVQNWKIHLRNGNFVNLNGNLNHRTFRFGTKTFEEFHLASKWKFEDLNGTFAWKGNRIVGNPLWKADWDLVLDVEGGFGRTMELTDGMNYLVKSKPSPDCRSLSNRVGRTNKNNIASSIQLKGVNSNQLVKCLQLSSFKSVESNQMSSQSWLCTEDPPITTSLMDQNSSLERVKDSKTSLSMKISRKLKSGTNGQISRMSTIEDLDIAERKSENYGTKFVTGKRKYVPWTKQENIVFHEGVEIVFKELNLCSLDRIGYFVWEQVSQSFVKTRSPQECQKKYNNLRLRRRKHLQQETQSAARSKKGFSKNKKWSDEEVKALLEGASIHGRKWKMIVEKFDNLVGRNDISCHMKFSQLYDCFLDNPNINVDEWHAREHSKLLHEVEYNGKDFSTVSNEIGTKNEKQCRDWYHLVIEGKNNLSNPVRNKFSPEEDLIISKVYEENDATMNMKAKYETICKEYSKKSILQKSYRQIERRARILQEKKDTFKFGWFSEREIVISVVCNQFPSHEKKAVIRKYMKGRNRFQIRDCLFNMRFKRDKFLNLLESDRELILCQLYKKNGNFDFLEDYLNERIPRRYHTRFKWKIGAKWNWEETLKLFTVRYKIENGKPLRNTVKHMHGWNEKQCQRRITLTKQRFPNPAKELPLVEIHELYILMGETWDFLSTITEQWLNEPPSVGKKALQTWFCSDDPKTTTSLIKGKTDDVELEEDYSKDEGVGLPKTSKMGNKPEGSIFGGESISGKRKNVMWTKQEIKNFDLGIVRVFKEWNVSHSDRIVSAVWETVSRSFVKTKSASKCRAKFNQMRLVRKKPRKKRSKRTKKKWNDDEIQALLRGVSVYGRKWSLAAESVTGRTENGCAIRFGRMYDWFLENPSINIDRWHAREHSKLFLEVDYNGKDFSAIAKEIGTKTETQCRYWYDLVREGNKKLSRHVPNQFSSQEDRIILDVMEEYDETLNLKTKFKLICEEYMKKSIPLKSCFQIEKRFRNLQEKRDTSTPNGGFFSRKEDIITVLVGKLSLKKKKNMIRKFMKGRGVSAVEGRLFKLRAKDDGFLKFVKNDRELQELFKITGNFDFLDDYMQLRLPRIFHNAFRRKRNEKWSWEETLKLMTVRYKIECGKTMRDTASHLAGRSESQCFNKLARTMQLFPEQDEFPLDDICGLFFERGSWSFLSDFTRNWLNQPPGSWNETLKGERYAALKASLISRAERKDVKEER